MKKNLLSFALCAVMICTMLAGFASATGAASYHYYSFDMASYGATARSSNETKETSLNYSFIYMESYTGNSSYPCYLRVRETNTNAAATDSTPVAGTGARSLTYVSGYGVLNNSYYLKGQTSSSSCYSENLSGRWRP